MKFRRALSQADEADRALLLHLSLRAARPAKLHERRAAQHWPSRSAKPFVFRSAVIATIVLSTLAKKMTDRKRRSRALSR